MRSHFEGRYIRLLHCEIHAKKRERISTVGGFFPLLYLLVDMKRCYSEPTSQLDSCIRNTHGKATKISVDAFILFNFDIIFNSL